MTKDHMRLVILGLLCCLLFSQKFHIFFIWHVLQTL